MTAFLAASLALTLAAALILLIIARSVAARAGAPDPALAVHRRHLAELGELSQRGLLDPEDERAARAEAARRLLSSAADAPAPETRGSRRSTQIILVTALCCAVLAFGVYVKLGAPGVGDAPYKARLARWRASDPMNLDPQRLAAVLRQVTRERPDDPRGFEYLGRMEAASGDPYLAARAFARAAALNPANPQYPLLEGEALLDAAGGKTSPEAEAALRRALAADPRNLAARYSLGRALLERGERAGGLALWRALLADIPPSDPRRPAFARQIDALAAGADLRPPETAGASAGPPPEAMGFIRAMVEGLKARLQARPDDPEGWARLVRSYGVLHDRPGQEAALAGARRALGSSPAKLAPVLAEARDHPP